ncbi:MAG TPA: hypothetical protein VF544_12445 [Pyrinomonadaceae bacterium]
MQTAPQALRLARKGRPRRRSERGAALITTLLIATLLLTAGGALILTTAMSGTNAVSATAEMHAYYAAEAGLQRALDILRLNVAAPPGTPLGLDGTTQASFRNVAGTNLGTWLQLPCADINRCSNIGGTPVMRVGTRGAYSILVTDPDNTPVSARPKRLRLTVTGYAMSGFGANGTRKVLDTMIMEAGLAGFVAPSTVTLIGATNPLAPPHLTLATGDSKNVHYSGKDAAKPTDPGYDPARAGDRPVFTTDLPSVPDITTGIERPLDQIIGDPVAPLGDGTGGTQPTPEWLTSADSARRFLNQLRTIARPNIDDNGLPVDTPDDRYFTSAMQPPASNVQGITFIEGDATLGPNNQGSGLLVVTGKLKLHGGTNFNGLILVLGEGVVEREGGGGGVINGGLVVAKFDDTGDFLSPTFFTDGGGNSTIQYNSAAVNTAASFVPGFLVAGVVEK